MRGARAKAGLAVCLVTAATVPLAVAGTASAAGPAKTARYIVVQDAASASGLGALGKADVDGERFAALGAVVTDLTHDQAAELNEVPGVTVSPDIRVNLVPDPGFKPTAPKRDGAPLTSLRPELSSTVASRSWGLDRLDQRSLPLSHSYTTRAGVRGQGVHVFVIDDGLATGHPEFRGRVGRGVDFVDGDYDPRECGDTPHGTHVAGTIGSSKFGVAPRVTLHGVRVLDCEGGGYYSDFVAAMDWVVRQRHQLGETVVANMSLGGPYNAAVNAATANMVRQGVVSVTAAGNDGDNAAYYSPASTPSAITVAASESNDHDAWYSNYGRVIDLYGPGTDIWSTYAYNSAYKLRLSGTSMAAPHVAGWAALYLGLHPHATPAQVRQALIGSGTRGRIAGEVGGTPDVLPYMRHLGLPS